MSSDFYWEGDAEQALAQRASADEKPSAVSVFRHGQHHNCQEERTRICNFRGCPISRTAPKQTMQADLIGR